MTPSITRPDRLHLGCGDTTPASWLNVDGSWTLRLAKHPTLFRALGAVRLLPRHVRGRTYNRDVFVHDLRKPLPFADNSFSAVYSSHTLEHMHLSETQQLLRECHRILRPGGSARMVVPDLESLVQEYLGQRRIPGFEGHFEPHTPADRMMRNLLMRPWTPVPAGLLYRTYSAMTDLHSHKWMFDAQSLSYHMQEAGFTGVRRREFRDTAIAGGVDEVEKPERVLDGRGVCVEGTKPAQ